MANKKKQNSATSKPAGTGGSLKIAIDQDLPRAHLARIIKTSKELTEELSKNQIVWPDPDTIDFESSDADFEITSKGFLSNAFGRHSRRRQQRQQQQKTKKQPRKQKLPNPKVVLEEVKESFAGIPYAGAKGNLAIAGFNGEFLDLKKARYFKDVYVEIFSHFHLIFLIEVDPEAISYLAEVTGMGGECCSPNSRGQAVAIMYNKERLEQVGDSKEYKEMADIQGIPDLRPALRLDFRDLFTNEEFAGVVVHPKSMRGGPQVTANIRYRQFDKLQKALGPDFVGIIGGDMNFILDNPKLQDADPLKNNGYELLVPDNHVATQSMGSRIDGYFLRGIKRKVNFYQVRAYWRNPKITRAYSDHAVTSFQMIYCEVELQLEKSKPNPGCCGDSSDAFPVEVPMGNSNSFTFTQRKIRKIKFFDLGVLRG